nr:hypothetical protein [Tanacetum cinerariifolium]
MTLKNGRKGSKPVESEKDQLENYGNSLLHSMGSMGPTGRMTSVFSSDMGVSSGSAINRVSADVDSLSRTFLGLAEGIARLRFRYLFVLPSPSAVTYVSATFPCIVSKRQGTDAVCYTKPSDSLKGWNDHIFWIGAFACPTLICGILVRIGERQRDDDEPKLFKTTIGRVVPLLPVAPDRSSGELEASVDKLFDEGGSGEQAEQGDSESGGRGVGIDVVAETIVEDSSIHRLLVGAVQNAVVRGGITPTLPFVSSSVSTTPECEGGDHTELLTGANLYAIGSLQRFVISSDFSDHSGVNIMEAEVDYVVRTSMPIITSATTTTPTVDPAAIAKEKLVGSYIFGADSPFAGESHPIPGGFSDCTGSDFLIGGIRTVIDPDSNLQKVYMSLSAKVCICVKYNIRKRRRLNSIVGEKDALLKAKDEEIRSLKAQLVLKEAEAAKAIRLRAEASNFEDVEKSLQSEVADLKERNNLLETEKNRLDVKVADLAASVKVREYPPLYLSLSPLLCFAIVLSLYFRVFLAIGKAVEKGMQDGLSAGITHGAEVRVLTDVAAYNPSTKADYLAALQHLQSVNFSLIAELKSNKYASIDTIMNLLRLEDSLAEKLGLTDSQPHVDQLMVPIHHPPDQRVIGASALSLLLNVSSFRVRGSCFPSRSLSLCAPFPSAFVTSYGPSHVGPNFPVSSTRLASLLRSKLISRASLFPTRSISAVLSVGMPIFAGMTTSVQYISENEVSLLLDFIIVRCAYRT